MKGVVLLCVVAGLLLVAEASSPLGVVYPFPIDSILKCRQPDPHKPEGTTEVPTPTIPLVPGEPDEVWLPEDIRFRAPPGTIDAAWLLGKLKNETNYIEGVHHQVCPPPDDTPPPVRSPELEILGSAMLPPMVDTINQSTIQLEGEGFTSAEQAVIMEFWDEVGFPECDEAIYEVTELPDYYYPPCYTAGRCSGESCSLPEGQLCMSSTRNTVELPVYRWDCCWDYDGAVWRWACGFYLVNIQIVTQCYCTCRPVFDS